LDDVHWIRTVGRLRQLARLLVPLCLAWLLLAGGGHTFAGETPVVSPALYLPLVVQQAGEPQPPPGPGTERPTWSSPVVVSPSDQAIWIVNPDANTVTVLDGAHFTRTAEIQTGDEPWSIAATPDGRQVWVANRAGGTVTVIDAASHTAAHTVAVGAEPGALALTPDGAYALVTLMAEDAVAIVHTRSYEVTARLAVGPVPYALAVAGDGQTAYVTHLIAQPYAGGTEAADDSRRGQVTILDLATQTVTGTIDLLPNVHGSPNRLTSITLAGERAWLPHVRAAPALPNGLTTTVFAAVLSLDLAAPGEETAAFVPLNDLEIFGSPVNNPAMAVPSPDGQRLYVVLSGSDLVEVVDVSAPQQPQLVKFLATGQNPQGMALNADGSRGFVMNYLSRSLTVVDLAQLAVVAEVSTTAETLAPEILRGKILFNTARDTRLAQGSWVSCASCHFDGWPDGVTWIFPDGPRQTPMLWNAGDTLPWHWSAALDEPQDVEETIQVIQRGLGLAPGLDPPLLGAPLAGRSDDLDALAAFLTGGLRAPTLATAAGDEEGGRALFVSKGCAACHGGPAWTASTLPAPAGAADPDGNGMVDAVLHDVGTFNELDLRGHTGFDPPSLLAVGLTAPYLHDGAFASLAALLAAGHPRPADGDRLDENEVASLVQFLQTIGPATTPVAVE
jgi:YVTN family beta-propeller protein